jgi:hypothetical protein
MVSAHVSPAPRPRPSPSLRGWMMLIGLLAVLPMLVFSLLAGNALLRQKRAALHLELQQIADFGARELAREIRVMYATLDALAVSDNVRNADYAALHAHASRITAVSPRIGAITAVDANGVRILTTLAPFKVVLPPAALSDFDRQVIASGQRQISALTEGFMSGKKLVSFALPIKDGDTLRMLLRATMWSEAIAEVIHEQPLPAGWLLAVVDQNMIQIARSREAARFVGTPATQFTQDAIRSNVRVPYTAITADGVTMTATVAKVAGTQWSVVVAAPSASIDAETWLAFRSMLWIGLFCALISALGTWMLAHKLRRGVERTERP